MYPHFGGKCCLVTLSCLNQLYSFSTFMLRVWRVYCLLGFIECSHKVLEHFDGGFSHFGVEMRIWVFDWKLWQPLLTAKQLHFTGWKIDGDDIISQTSFPSATSHSYLLFRTRGSILGFLGLEDRWPDVTWQVWRTLLVSLTWRDKVSRTILASGTWCWCGEVSQTILVLRIYADVEMYLLVSRTLVIRKVPVSRTSQVCGPWCFCRLPDLWCLFHKLWFFVFTLFCFLFFALQV